VASATDNSSSFAIAQGIRGEISAIEGINKSVVKVKGIVDYNLAAAEGISGLINDIRKKLTELTDATLSAPQRTQLIADFNDLLSQGKDFARATADLDQLGNTSIDLFSAVSKGAEIADVVVQISPNLSGTASIAQQSITIGHASTVAVFNRLTSLQTSTYTATVANAVSTLSGAFQNFEAEVGTALGHLSSKSRQLGAHSEFLNTLKNTRQEQLGSYVDADLAAESARLTALQVQQQLAVQSIGIANQRPQSLLGLFR
jgi:flagellin